MLHCKLIEKRNWRRSKKLKLHLKRRDWRRRNYEGKQRRKRYKAPYLWPKKGNNGNTETRALLSLTYFISNVDFLSFNLLLLFVFTSSLFFNTIFILVGWYAPSLFFVCTCHRVFVHARTKMVYPLGGKKFISPSLWLLLNSKVLGNPYVIFVKVLGNPYVISVVSNV